MRSHGGPSLLHRRTDSKVVITDGPLLAEIEQVRHALDMAKRVEQFNSQGLEDESPRLQRRLVELAQKATEEATIFVAQALPGEEFDDLVRQHPPTPKQLEHYRERVKAAPMAVTILEPPDMNPDSMGLELLAACLIEPRWSRGELEDFWRALSKGEQTDLWNWVHRLNIKGADLPFFNAATATTNGGGDRSSLPVNGASPSQSS